MIFNKKYAIRKLSVGVASVAIGFLMTNANIMLNPIGVNNVVYAAEATETIYTNPNPNDTIENDTNNNAISKIEIISKDDKKIRLRVSVADGLNLTKKIKIQLANGLYVDNSDLIFSNEAVGRLSSPYSVDKEIKSPENFSTFEEYYSYLKGLSPTSEEMYRFAELDFNNNFKKYDKNRYVEFEIKISQYNPTVNLIVKQEDKNTNTKKLENIATEIPKVISINGEKIYDLKSSSTLTVQTTPWEQPTQPNTDTFNVEKPFTTGSASGNSIYNKPIYLNNFQVMMPRNIHRLYNQFGFPTLENTKGQTVVKKGTKFKITLKSNILNNTPLKKLEGFVTFNEYSPATITPKEIFAGEQLLKRDKAKNQDITHDVRATYERLDDKTYELTLQEDVVFENNTVARYGLSMPSELYDVVMKDDYLNYVNIDEYKEGLKTDRLNKFFGKTELSVKEPNDQDYKKITENFISVGVNSSFVFGESSTVQ